jgi:hypothetical protein
MADIRDLPTIESNISNDFFIFQRDSVTTYKINYQNLLTECVKYSDDFLSLIGNVPWNYLTYHPTIDVTLSGEVIGYGSIDLTDQTNLQINVSHVNIPTQLIFTPVQQGGGFNQLNEKIYIGWSGEGLRAQVNNTDLGPFLFREALTWANLVNIPTLNVSLTGKAIGTGSVDLSFSNNLVINVDSVEQNSVLWSNVNLKPTLRFTFPDFSYKDIVLNDITDNQIYTVAFENVLMTDTNDISFGSNSTAPVTIMGVTAPTEASYEYHFKIQRYEGLDNRLEFFNTVGGRNDRPHDKTAWFWDLDYPGDVSNICYKNRIEIWPLAVIPNLMVEKERVITLSVDTLIVESDIIVKDYGTVNKNKLFQDLPIGNSNQIYMLTSDNSNNITPHNLFVVGLFTYSEEEFQISSLYVPEEPQSTYIIRLDMWLVYYWNEESSELYKWEISTEQTVEDIIGLYHVVCINQITEKSFFVQNSTHVFRMTPA